MASPSVSQSLAKLQVSTLKLDDAVSVIPSSTAWVDALRCLESSSQGAVLVMDGPRCLGFLDPVLLSTYNVSVLHTVGKRGALVAFWDEILGQALQQAGLKSSRATLAKVGEVLQRCLDGKQPAVLSFEDTLLQV
jgi:hypothetical protein